jgi:hypothetical protein
MKKKHPFPALAVALAIIIGCSSSKKVERVEKPPPSTTAGGETSRPDGILNEDLDPMTLQAPEFRVPRRQAARAAAEARRDTLAILRPAPTDTSWQKVPGYQVQLLQTEDAQLARETVKDAILALETDVEIIYEAPYYKVRAGRFTSRYDAEQLQNLAEEKGYANCWVVRTQVKVRASDLLNQK